MKFSARCNLPAGRFSEDWDPLKRGVQRAAARNVLGTCDLTFTDPDAFVAHMKEVHGRRVYNPPTIKPYAHKAPPVPSEARRAANLAKIAEHLATGKKYDYFRGEPAGAVVESVS